MNILIIRLSAIGDIVMSSPIAETLKQWQPEAKITWLVQPENKALLLENPNVDQIITWDKNQFKQQLKSKAWSSLHQEYKALKTQLRAEQFDLCLDLQGLMKSGLLAKLSGAKKIIGLGSKEGSQWLVHETLSRQLGDTQMISSEYRSMTEHVTGLSQFELKNHYSEQTWVSAQSKLKQAFEDKRYWVICPFTTRPQKHWFDDYWQQLAEQLAELGLPIVMLGGPADIAHAAKITDGTSIINLVGQTSLLEASAIIDHASGVIGVDTGLTHMGHAAKTPTLCLFGSTQPYLKTGLTTSEVLHYPALCTPGKHDPRPECEGCMRDLTPSLVIEHFTRLVGA
ncbi:MAG: glycosyltransferase family 9 protein [Pseudomonadota bacterium]|nr:glycosyltransferase family 9 protein [Pseudomonadota bacterium]